MNETVTEAKAEFTRAKHRLAHALANTPEDRLNWSPALTARTPLEIAAHASLSVGYIQAMLSGQPMPPMNPAEMDSAARKDEKAFTSREQVQELMEKTSADYVAWLDSLTPEQLTSTIDTPFGTFPVAFAITFPADHMRGHVSQIEYLQTIYGDRDWHVG